MTSSATSRLRLDFHHIKVDLKNQKSFDSYCNVGFWGFHVFYFEGQLCFCLCHASVALMSLCYWFPCSLCHVLIGSLVHCVVFSLVCSCHVTLIVCNK